ncbi:hypothetical protein RHMOL_Rhmol06G0262600 [Rhododendron molle]|uniref:Uncharacterized protein n=1 Tax=Rhododendron molle TaxID=49168 RepID=A0ACC0NGJ8_RHOML|nr:hypothetical protein RHMOL_Rhmol06G0262600 [Rhododendron molle]
MAIKRGKPYTQQPQLRPRHLNICYRTSPGGARFSGSLGLSSLSLSLSSGSQSTPVPPQPLEFPDKGCRFTGVGETGLALRLGEPAVDETEDLCTVVKRGCTAANEGPLQFLKQNSGT